MFKPKTKKLNILILTVILIAGVLLWIGWQVIAANNGNTQDYAFSEKTGWMRMDGTDSTQTYGVTVPTSGTGDLSGYSWLENAGWVHFAGNCVNSGECPDSANDYAVAATTTGCTIGWSCLSGYAWGEGIGWIRFAATGSDYTNASASTYGVYIDSNEDFNGYAWSEQVGWIHFENTSPYDYGVSFIGPPTYTLATTTGQTINVSGDLTIGDGTDEVVVTGLTKDPILDVDGNVSVAANATFVAPELSSFTVGGNWTNTGTFTHNSGTVTFDGAGGSTQDIYGDTTFNNFTATTSSARTLRFGTDDTQTVNGIWTVTGASGQLITLGLICPTGYILVPGNATFGTDDFCVMQYEAKNDGSGNAISQADTTPWASITQTAAITECSDAGGHLITNNEWMTIARNVEAQTANWADGVVGSLVSAGGGLKRGNVGILDSASYNASSDPDYGTSRDTKAQLVLSNGETIWDLSGNVWEWTNDTCAQANWYNSGAWIDWTNANLADYEKPNGGPSGSYDSTYGTGRYYGCTAEGNAFQRGGDWSSTSDAGVFTLALGAAPAASSTRLGFRCAQ